MAVLKTLYDPEGTAQLRAVSLFLLDTEHTVAPEVVAHRLLRRTMEHLQERMACREA